MRSRAWAARAEQLVEEHVLGGGGRLDDLLPCPRPGGPAAARGRPGTPARAAAGLAARDADAVVLSRLTIAFGICARGAGRGDRRLRRGHARRLLRRDLPGRRRHHLLRAVPRACSLRDVARARTWTATLDRWCAARPDLVPYRGTCLVHRAQMSTLGGRLGRRPGRGGRRPAVAARTGAGQAAYQLGELHRLMGDDAEAEDAYRRANALGVQPDRGSPDCAPPRAAPRWRPGRCGACATSRGRPRTVPSCSPHGWTPSSPSATSRRPGTAGSCGHHRGAGLAAAVRARRPGRRRGAARRGRPDDGPRRAAAGAAALDRARPPARLRPGARPAGRCLRELATSRRPTWSSRPPASASSGWAPDRTSPASTSWPRPAPRRGPPGRLTDREVEVVRLVAAGTPTGRSPVELSLSEKTVARHLANIYAKLDVPSRAAATAYAYDHGLV